MNASPAEFLNDHVGGSQRDVFGRGGSAVSEPFKGTINVDIRDSVPDWSPFEPPKAPDGAPNVVYIVLDDVGLLGDELLRRADRDAEHRPDRG